MKLVLADNLEKARDKYIEVIENTENIYQHAGWVYGKHPDDELLQAYIDNEELYFFMDGENIAGMAAVTMYQGPDYEPVEWAEKLGSDEVAALHILTICPEYQRKGISGKMIGQIIELARARGKKSVRLDTLRTNIPAQGMYRKMGFSYRGAIGRIEESLGWAEFMYYEYVLE